MAARSYSISLWNYTSVELVRNHVSLDSGEWTDSMLPPETIKPDTHGRWESQSDGFGTGTAGTVAYDFVGGGQLKIHWNNPFLGENSYSYEIDRDYRLVCHGGSGFNAGLSCRLVS